MRSEFLHIMKERGFIHQCTHLEGLDALLASETVTAYCGIDPTGDSLHVGHMVPYLMMRWLQKCGHKVIVLVGGVTALIADPTGKDETRKMLSEAQVKVNSEAISQFFQKILVMEEKSKPPSQILPACLVNNADWLRQINYIDFLRDYGSHFSVNRMLSMESVKMRLDREQPLSFLEFNYMILQGYDFLHLYRTQGCRLQMSGADQWGNVIQGVELARRTEQVELFGLTAPLLLTSSGKKMGKTEGGAVWLSAEKLSPHEYYQYWRNTEDSDVARFLKMFTELPMDEISHLESLKGKDINEAKKILAFEATRMVHGTQAAETAAETARQAFENGLAAEGLPTLKLNQQRLQQGVPAYQLFKEAGLATSNGEARRLIEGGGAKLNDQKLTDPQFVICIKAAEIIKLSAGKRKHALVMCES